jgi:hypothetical protein
MWITSGLARGESRFVGGGNMTTTRINELVSEAANCRRKALTYLGRREAPFLLRVAREFERLAAEPHTEPGISTTDE